MRLNVEVKREIYEEFVAHAERDGRSISDVIRTLIIDWNRRKRTEIARDRAFVVEEKEE